MKNNRLGKLIQAQQKYKSGILLDDIPVELNVTIPERDLKIWTKKYSPNRIVKVINTDSTVFISIMTTVGFILDYGDLEDFNYVVKPYKQNSILWINGGPDTLKKLKKLGGQLQNKHVPNSYFEDPNHIFWIDQKKNIKSSSDPVIHDIIKNNKDWTEIS